jgi:glycosyltransferase involved in cell wall biosynthesis
MTHTKLRKVLFLVDALYADAGGGSERQFLKLYERTESIGIDPYVVFLRDAPVHGRLPWHRPPLLLNIGSLKSPRVLIGAYRILHLLRKERIEIIQTLFDDATLIGGIIKLLKPRIRLVCSLRNLGHSHSGLKKRLLTSIYRFSDRMVVNAQSISSLLVNQYGIPAGKISTISNICDISRETRAPILPELEILKQRHTLLAVTVANLRPVKGIDELLEAAIRTKDKIDIGYIVIGDGGGLDYYQAQVKEKGLENTVHLWGYRTDVERVLPHVDLAILPSRSEGLSNALVEYTLAGLATIATDVGGNREALDNGHCGLLVPAHDSTALADAILQLTVDATIRHNLGQAARQYAARRYDSSQICRQYADLYQTL